MATLQLHRGQGQVSTCHLVSPETIQTLKEFYVSFFEIDGPWKDFTAVTKLITRFKRVHVLVHDYNNMVFCSEKVLKK